MKQLKGNERKHQKVMNRETEMKEHNYEVEKKNEGVAVT